MTWNDVQFALVNGYIYAQQMFSACPYNLAVAGVGWLVVLIFALLWYGAASRAHVLEHVLETELYPEPQPTISDPVTPCCAPPCKFDNDVIDKMISLHSDALEKIYIMQTDFAQRLENSQVSSYNMIQEIVETFLEDDEETEDE